MLASVSLLDNLVIASSQARANLSLNLLNNAQLYITSIPVYMVYKESTS